MATHALTQLAAQAQPVDRIIFDETTELVCGLDVAKTSQLGIFVALARRDVFERRPGAKIADVEERDARAVARPAKLVDRSGTADRENRDRPQLPVLRSDEIRRVLSADADHGRSSCRTGEGSIGSSNGGAGSVNAVCADYGLRRRDDRAERGKTGGRPPRIRRVADSGFVKIFHYWAPDSALLTESTGVVGASACGRAKLPQDCKGRPSCDIPARREALGVNIARTLPGRAHAAEL